MGEFLLHILGLNHAGEVIYIRKVKYSQFKAGDLVPYVYPNPNRKTKHGYYRILERFYKAEDIVELLTTKDPNVIDQNAFVTKQRRLQGKDMYLLSCNRHSFQNIALQYPGWNKHAVEHAIKLYLKAEEDEAERKSREHIASVLAEEEPIPMRTTEEQQAHIKALLDNWGD